MALGMTIAAATLGWIGLLAALLLGHSIWLALAVQSGLGAGLVLVWSTTLAVRARAGAWMSHPADPRHWRHTQGAALPPAAQRAPMPPR